MNILLYGSTHLTAAVLQNIRNRFNLVGHVPSANPRIPGIIDLPVVKNIDECDHDIKLSVQYDKKILDYHNAFNVHTGLLPRWGGGDILYHTIKQQEREQGITFHKMTSQFDYGPIISKITYPVLKGDNVIDLYERLYRVIPSFVNSSLQLLESIGIENVHACYKEHPVIYKRKKSIYVSDLKEYETTGKRLIELYGANND